MRESQWTPPRLDCPNPGYWHTDSGQGTELEVTELVAALVRALQPELIVETGTYDGQTTRAIGEALARNRHGRLVAVERDAELVRAAADKTADLPVQVVHGDSLTCPILDRPIDMLWLDSGMHTDTGEMLRVAEYRRFRPHLSTRAVVVVHDSAKHALAAALDDLDLNTVHLPTPRGITVARPR